MISKGQSQIPHLDISESSILAYYLGITQVPCLINSPFREDKHPSFSIYSPDKIKILYKDFATGEHGSIFGLLERLWNCSYKEVLNKIHNDTATPMKILPAHISTYRRKNTKLECKVRKWKNEDIAYWESYGISLDWLKFADVYPISHIIFDTSIIAVKSIAYAFAEFKENRCTLKIYQPKETSYKWLNNHDGSVISLWTKIPKTGSILCICSSLKDALCLWANIGIPTIALQGEGYELSNTALHELKSRFKKIFICLDNDKPGIEYSKRLANTTGFINIILPYFEGGKDISDYYKVLNNKELFKKQITKLFLQ